MPPAAPMMIGHPGQQQQQHQFDHQPNMEQTVGAPLDFLLPIDVSFLFYVKEISNFKNLFHRQAIIHWNRQCSACIIWALNCGDHLFISRTVQPKADNMRPNSQTNAPSARNPPNPVSLGICSSLAKRIKTRKSRNTTTP